MSVLSDHDALFRAVCADPEDDTPRLALADWLDEDGQADRAALVRAQVEFARLTADGSDSQAVYEFLDEHDPVTKAVANWAAIDPGLARRFALRGRIDDLRQRNGPAWVAELPAGCGVNWHEFRRGFPGRAEVADIDLLVASAARVTAVAPPVELVCPRLTAADARRLADAGLLGWARGLVLHGDYADGLRELGRHPAAAGVRTLVVRSGDGTGGHLLAVALAGSPHWAGLRALDAGGLWLESIPAEVLFRAPHLRGLTRLHLEGANWTADTVRTFAEAAFPDLTDLRFTRSGLGDDAAGVLANVPSLGTVRYLDLGYNQVAGPGATALLCSPHLADLAFLGLAGNPVRGLDRAALRAAPAGGLRLFHAHGCGLSVGDVAALARAPRLRHLWYLDLDANGLGPGAARAIARGFGDRCPAILWLTENRLDDADAVELADWPAAAALRLLQVSGNDRLTDSGVKALLNSPHLRNLDGLGVSGVSEPVARAVRARFGGHGGVG